MPVEVKGGYATRKALRQFEPDLAKETTKQIASFLKPVVIQARGFLPSNDKALSGWVKNAEQNGSWAKKAYDASTIKRGITYKSSPSKANSRGFRSLATVYNKTAAGSIYEWAGRISGIKGNFTPRLGGELKGKRNQSGRVIIRAVEEDQGKAKANIIKAIQSAADKLNARTKL